MIDIIHHIQLLVPERHILFGEWVAAKHSIFYTRLPAYFIAFDVFDKEAGKFFSRRALEEFLEPWGIPIVQKITEGVFESSRELFPLLDTISVYGARKSESGDLHLARGPTDLFKRN